MTRVALIAVLVGAGGCVVAYEARTSAVGESEGAAGSGDTEGRGDTETTVSGGEVVCTAEQSVCASTCVDLEEHPDHCGGCGVSCGVGEACDRAECREGCRNGELICDRYCVDITLDEEHCGGCGHACAAGVACVDGNCGAACDPECDRERERCADGVCECRPGLSVCDGSCVDLGADPLHCGMCGRDCGADACGDGECVSATCDGFPNACDGSCTDLSEDPLHCGQCGEPCEALETCVEGECTGT